MSTRNTMNLIILLTFVLWSRVHSIVEYHSHIHRHLRPSDGKTIDFRSQKGNVAGSNIPSAGDGALNPWLYRFPPWTKHNPPPPTLALTNGDALKSPPNVRDISSLRRAPHDEERFVFHDVKVDLDLPYVNEVVRTVLATQGQDSEDDYLVYGEEEDRLSHNSLRNKKRVLNAHPKNGLLSSYENSIMSPNYPTKPSSSDGTSKKIVFLKTNNVFPLYEVYAKPNLISKYREQTEDFSFPEDRSLNAYQPDSFSIDSSRELPPQMYHDNLINSTHVLFPAKELHTKMKEKTNIPRKSEELGLTPRGLNSRLSSSVNDGPKYPTSIQDIINEQKSSYFKEPNTQIDPRHNRPSRQTRLSRRSKFLGSKWVWSDDLER